MVPRAWSPLWLTAGLLACDPSAGSPKSTATDSGATLGAEGPGDVVDSDSDSDDDSASDPDEVAATAMRLSDADRLLRISMTVRGTRPSIEEYDAVDANPDAVVDLVDAWLDDERFGATVRDIENQTLLVRWEQANRDLPEGAPIQFEWTRLRNEEPLHLIEYVVMQNRPYTDILAMPGTIGSAWHSEMWSGVGGDFDPDGPDWQPYHYTDGRDEAGVLSTGGFQFRWASNPNNAKRLAAAAAARALICVDYFTADIPLGSVDLTDDDAVENAILNEPACVACHQTLDPLAGTLQGFVGRVGFNLDYPTAAWDPDTVDDGPGRTGRENGYFGLGGGSLSELGALMVTDSRFSQCTARRYIGWMTQSELSTVDDAWVREAQGVLVDADMDLKAMVKAIVLSDAFAVSHDTDPDAAASTPGLLQARPEQLDRMFADLAGFEWVGTVNRNPLPLPIASSAGFRVHGGGIDSIQKVTPVHLSSATASAFLRSFAAEAAAHVVTTDLELDASERRLLHGVEVGTTDESTVRAQLAWLHQRVYGEDDAEDSTSVDRSWVLFQALQATTGDTQRTWTLLLTAMFQDHRVAWY